MHKRAGLSPTLMGKQTRSEFWLLAAGAMVQPSPVAAPMPRRMKLDPINSASIDSLIVRGFLRQSPSLLLMPWLAVRFKRLLIPSISKVFSNSQKNEPPEWAALTAGHDSRQELRQ